MLSWINWVLIAHLHDQQATQPTSTTSLQSSTMPPVRSARNRKPPPEGFQDIEDTLIEFHNKMKDAENMPYEGKRRHEVMWPIFRINHQRE